MAPIPQVLELASFIASETDKWTRVIRAAGVVLE
jgi:hypothetical protein